MSELAIDASNVTKTYGVGGVAVHALRGVDFHAREGEFVMLNGPSGSGKTTLLSILGCVLTPSAGEVRIWHGKSEVAVHRRRAAPVEQQGVSNDEVVHPPILPSPWSSSN